MISTATTKFLVAATAATAALVVTLELVQSAMRAAGTF